MFWRRDGALVSVNATVSDVVRCLTPAFAQGPGVYDLALSVDSVESEALQFEVRDDLELLEMDLDVSTALGGASTLIKLRHLELPTSDAECRFGSATVPATYWRKNVVQCKVPAHAAGCTTAGRSAMVSPGMMAAPDMSCTCTVVELGQKQRGAAPGPAVGLGGQRSDWLRPGRAAV